LTRPPSTFFCWFTSPIDFVSCSLTVPFAYLSCSNSWKLWDARVWIGLDANDIPKAADGGADLDSFPYADTELAGADTYTFTIPLESTSSCSEAAEYQLVMATYSYIGDPCVPSNGESSVNGAH